uniref:MARVEL domain-containing protein n=1 Tax=Parastrongyloides trichosuri TaxID=131310 RepID=A0A0N4ZLP0_PARTI
MARLNLYRLRTLPNIIKTTTTICSIIILIIIGSTLFTSTGGKVVQVTSTANIIVNVILISLLALELDDKIIPKSSLITWPLIEMAISITFTILYFISIWLCVSGSNFINKGKMTWAGIFVLANFAQYTMNTIMFAEIWYREKKLNEPSETIPVSDIQNINYGIA